MIDVFPPQSHSICAELFVKARPGPMTGEVQNSKRNGTKGGEEGEIAQGRRRYGFTV